MKKTLFIIIGAIFLVLFCISIFKGIPIGKFSIYSIKDIQEKSIDLDKTIKEADTQINLNYAKSVADLETASVDLNKIKEQYQSKIGANGELGISEIEKYKIEYLWWLIGDYAAEEELRLYLDIQKTTLDDTYNVTFTLYGDYNGITNFLYDIENDDNLNYRIQNFNIEASRVNDLPSDLAQRIIDEAKSKKEEIPEISTDILTATFLVENVVINFD